MKKHTWYKLTHNVTAGSRIVKKGTKVKVVDKRRGNGDWTQNKRSPVIFTVEAGDGIQFSLPKAALAPM
jgi:hypothetical protein